MEKKEENDDDVFNTLTSLFLDSTSNNEECIMSKNQELKDQIDDIENIFSEVNTMIGNLKTKLVIADNKDIPKISLLNSYEKKCREHISSIFDTKKEKENFKNIISNIKNIRDKAIFGLIIDMIYETITPKKTSFPLD